MISLCVMVPKEGKRMIERERGVLDFRESCKVRK